MNTTICSGTSTSCHEVCCSVLRRSNHQGLYPTKLRVWKLQTSDQTISMFVGQRLSAVEVKSVLSAHNQIPSYPQKGLKATGRKIYIEKNVFVGVLWNLKTATDGKFCASGVKK